MTERDIERIRPDPRMARLIECAIDEVATRLRGEDGYAEWLSWAASWKQGRRSPAECVAVSHRCSALGHHALGQIAWGAKEACYTTPTSGWLVIRYVADAMVAFGAAFPEKGLPMIEADPDRLTDQQVNIGE